MGLFFIIIIIDNTPQTGDSRGRLRRTDRNDPVSISRSRQVPIRWRCRDLGKKHYVALNDDVSGVSQVAG